MFIIHLVNCKYILRRTDNYTEHHSQTDWYATILKQAIRNKSGCPKYNVKVKIINDITRNLNVSISNQIGAPCAYFAVVILSSFIKAVLSELVWGKLFNIESKLRIDNNDIPDHNTVATPVVKNWLILLFVLVLILKYILMESLNFKAIFSIVNSTVFNFDLF